MLSHGRMKSIYSMRDLVRTAGQDFYRSRLTLIAYSVVIKLAEAWLVVPVIALGLTLLLRMSGHVALSNWDAYQFLISIPGALYLGLLSSLTITLVLFEQAGIMNLAHSTATFEPRSLSQLLSASFPQPWRVAKFGLILLAAIGVVSIPVILLLFLIHHFFLSRHDINYYVTEMPADFWWASGLGTAVLLAAASVALVLSVRWSLALPIILFERQQPLAAMRSSHQRNTGDSMRIGVILVGWLALVIALTFLLETGLSYFAKAVLARAGDEPIIVTVLLLFLQTCLISTVTFLSNAGFSLMTRRLYLENCPPSADPLQSPSTVMENSSSVGHWATIFGLAVLTAMIPVSIWMNVSRLSSERPALKVTAHRGHSRAAPENTISAVRKAIDSGADFAEIDVLLTSDGVPVLLHDSDLKRTAGDVQRISDVTFEQARLLDVGSWFSPQFVGETIPTLSEVLELSKGKIKLNIELKIYDPDPRLVPAIVQQIVDHGFESDCIVTTFKYETLQEIKRLSPRLKTGQIIAHALGDVSRLEVDALSVRANWLMDSVLRQAHQQGMEVHVWTVNEAADMYRLIKRGVDNIITDDPDLMIEVKRKWESLSSTERLVLASRLLLGLSPDQ